MRIIEGKTWNIFVQYSCKLQLLEREKERGVSFVDVVQTAVKINKIVNFGEG